MKSSVRARAVVVEAPVKIRVETDDSGEIFRFCTKEDGRIVFEIIRIKMTVDGLGVYQKGRNTALLEACRLAVDVVRARGKSIYLIFKDRERRYLVEAESSPFEIEHFLLS